MQRESNTEETRARLQGRRGSCDLRTPVFTARACLVEVIGELPCRMQMKLREAYAVDKPASGGEVQYLQQLRVYGRRDGSDCLLILPGEICGVPQVRKAVERKDES